MTTRKHLKAHVRARMARTGERYAVARSHVVARAPLVEPVAETPTTVPGSAIVHGIRHLPGLHPETTVLRILATHAGVRDGSGDVPSEAAMLAVGGGLGAGVFAFHYAKEPSASLFLAGQHRWEDPAGFVVGGLRRLGLEPRVRETGSARAAERDLREALDEGGPVAAWVDWIELRTRGGRPEESGGGYHAIVVYAVESDEAIVGDLFDEPVRVPLEVLARARARIAKHRHRLVTAAGSSEGTDLASAARAGLAAGAEALATERRRNFSLGAFADLADRMTATRGSNAWATVFPPGRWRWVALTSLHRYVETYFTGGGLLRPMAAAALRELGDEAAETLAERYTDLGTRWTALAEAALPSDVAEFREARHLQEAERANVPDAAAAAQRGERLEALARAAEDAFPLSEADAAAQLEDLAARLRDIHGAEAEALNHLRTMGR